MVRDELLILSHCFWSVYKKNSTGRLSKGLARCIQSFLFCNKRLIKPVGTVQRCLSHNCFKTSDTVVHHNGLPLFIWFFCSGTPLSLHLFCWKLLPSSDAPHNIYSSYLSAAIQLRVFPDFMTALFQINCFLFFYEPVNHCTACSITG